jgi:hypothetical protein
MVREARGLHREFSRRLETLRLVWFGLVHSYGFDEMSTYDAPSISLTTVFAIVLK